MDTVYIEYGSADVNGPLRKFMTIREIYWLEGADGSWPDLAVCKFVSSIQESLTVKFVKLPHPFELFEGMPAIISGYGGGKTVVNYGYFRVVPDSECHEGVHTICSVGLNSEVRTEGGDSGENSKTLHFILLY